MKKDHPVKKCGLLTSSKYPLLGISPDGMVNGHCDSKGLLEIKCPASEKWKMIIPEKCADDVNFLRV